MFERSTPLLLLAAALLMQACLFPIGGAKEATVEPLAPAATSADDATAPPDTLPAAPAATATPSPIPTPTPPPAIRLSAAEDAYHIGRYPEAAAAYASIVEDPSATPEEHRLALYWLGMSLLAEQKGSAEAISAFREFLERYPEDPLTRAVNFNLARALEEAGQYLAAADAYEAALKPQDSIADYLYQRIGQAAMLGLDYERALSAYRRGIAATADTGFVVNFRERIAEVHLAQGNPYAAVDEYQLILDVARIPSYRAKILYQLGKAYAVAEDAELAHRAYFEAINVYPDAYYSYLSLVELVQAGVEVDEYQRGLVNHYAGSHQPAVEAFARYLGAAGETYNPDVHWFAGLSLRALGNYDQASHEWQVLISNYPQNHYFVRAWFAIAETYAWSERYADAKAFYRRFAEQYPQSTAAPEALFRAAELELSHDDPAMAARSFYELAVRYQESKWAGDALYNAGYASYTAADHNAALAYWDELLQKQTIGEGASRTKFWRARALAALGQEEQARQQLSELASGPRDYYGLRAADLLAGEEITISTLTFDPPPPSGEEVAEAERWLAAWLQINSSGSLSQLDPVIAADLTFQRGAALVEVGLRREAITEFRSVLEKWGESPLALYQLALAFRDMGIYNLSISCAERLVIKAAAQGADEPPFLIRSLRYPLYYEELIVQAAQAEDIPPLLLFALVRQESLFDPWAESYAGARGLAQIMPATGEDIANRSGRGTIDVEELWKPYLNIEFSAWFLRELLNYFDKDPIAALAAYNAGPGRVQRWREAGTDIDEFVEAIPFAESKSYVRLIYQFVDEYRYLYSSRNAADNQ